MVAILDGKNWKKNHGASKDVLMKLASMAPFQLSESYVTFLSNSNGGEGPLSAQPCWLILYSAEEVIKIETDGSFHEFFPGYFVIGDNGGGEAIALVTDEDDAEKVACFDMTNSDLEESVVLVAPSFVGLISLLEDNKG